MATIGTFTPENILMSDDIETLQVNLAATLVEIPPLTPLTRDATGKAIVMTSIDEKCIGLTVIPHQNIFNVGMDTPVAEVNIPVSASPQTVTIYKEATLRMGAINFTNITDATNDDLKQSIADGTGLLFVMYLTGY